MKRLVFFQIIFISLFYVTCTPLSDEYVKSDFDTDIGDWRISGDGVPDPPTHFLTGGVGDSGYIGASDLGNNEFWYFSAPEKYLNNMARFSGGRMHFWLIQESAMSDQEYAADIIIDSYSGTMVHHFDYYPGLTWTEYTISMSDLEWTDVEGHYISNGEIFDILEEVKSIEIRGEFERGPDKGGLDEFSFYEI